MEVPSTHFCVCFGVLAAHFGVPSTRFLDEFKYRVVGIEFLLLRLGMKKRRLITVMRFCVTNLCQLPIAFILVFFRVITLWVLILREMDEVVVCLEPVRCSVNLMNSRQIGGIVFETRGGEGRKGV